MLKVLWNSVISIMFGDEKKRQNEESDNEQGNENEIESGGSECERSGYHDWKHMLKTCPLCKTPEDSELPSPKKKSKREYLKDKYETLQEIGSGGFSNVFHGVNIETRVNVAIKQIKRPGIHECDETALHQEIEILKAVDHPHIIKLYDVYKDEKYYSLVLELLEGGDVFDRLVTKVAYSEKDCRDLTFHLLEIIDYLHDKNIVHRDIKPENLLLTSKTDDADIKLADFGFAAECNGNNLNMPWGTLEYTAPEVHRGKYYGKAVDMWSFGVTMYVLLCGAMPFPSGSGKNSKGVVKAIIDKDYDFAPQHWSRVSNQAKELIQLLLVTDPSKRLTAKQAIKHEWFSDNIAATLKNIDLDKQLHNLKKAYKNRRFRKAVHTVMAVTKMQRLLAWRQHAQSDSNGDSTTSSGESESTSTSSSKITFAQGSCGHLFHSTCVDHWLQSSRTVEVEVELSAARAQVEDLETQQRDLETQQTPLCPVCKQKWEVTKVAYYSTSTMSTTISTTMSPSKTGTVREDYDDMDSGDEEEGGSDADAEGGDTTLCLHLPLPSSQV